MDVPEGRVIGGRGKVCDMSSYRTSEGLPVLHAFCLRKLDKHTKFRNISVEQQKQMTKLIKEVLGLSVEEGLFRLKELGCCGDAEHHGVKVFEAVLKHTPLFTGFTEFQKFVTNVRPLLVSLRRIYGDNDISERGAGLLAELVVAGIKCCPHFTGVLSEVFLPVPLDMLATPGIINYLFTVLGSEINNLKHDAIKHVMCLQQHLISSCNYQITEKNTCLLLARLVLSYERDPRHLFEFLSHEGTQVFDEIFKTFQDHTSRYNSSELPKVVRSAGGDGYTLLHIYSVLRGDYLQQPDVPETVLNVTRVSQLSTNRRTALMTVLRILLFQSHKITRVTYQYMRVVDVLCKFRQPSGVKDKEGETTITLLLKVISLFQKLLKSQAAAADDHQLNVGVMHVMDEGLVHEYTTKVTEIAIQIFDKLLKQEDEPTIKRLSLGNHVVTLCVELGLVEQLENIKTANSLFDFNIKNQEGQTLLHIAALKKRTEMVKYLINRPELDLNVKDKDGCTPIFYIVTHIPARECISIIRNHPWDFTLCKNDKPGQSLYKYYYAEKSAKILNKTEKNLMCLLRERCQHVPMTTRSPRTRSPSPSLTRRAVHSSLANVLFVDIDKIPTPRRFSEYPRQKPSNNAALQGSHRNPKTPAPSPRISKSPRAVKKSDKKTY